jgi:hypothetical protein
MGTIRHLVSPNQFHYAHIGEWSKAFPMRSHGLHRVYASERALGTPFERRTTVIRVVKGSGNLTPLTVKYSNGPSTIPMSGPIGLNTLIGS